VKQNKLLLILTILVVITGLLVSGFGLFSSTDNTSFQTVNQYGDVIKMSGDGVYAHDSLFKASVFRGTDFVVFFILCPLIILSLIIVCTKNTTKSIVMLVSLVGVMFYYSVNIVFGASYNNLLLLYIVLFSLSTYAFIVGLMSIDRNKLQKLVSQDFPGKGVYILLVLSGLALFGAWLPDIINGLILNRPIELIEVYTTEVTYVLDMGIVSPTIFICIYLLRNRNGLGYALLQVILSSCGIIGLMIVSQSLFQHLAGISHPIPVLITKMGIFVILSFFSFYYSIKFMKAIKEEKLRDESNL